jgi:hypothetical protein
VEVVTHPDSRINPAIEEYTRLDRRPDTTGTLWWRMIRTPGRTARRTATADSQEFASASH